MLREQFQDSAKRVSVETAKGLACAAYAAMFFAPATLNHAVQETRVDTRITNIPAELGFYPGGSRLDILNQANIYTDDEVMGIGISARVTGLPRVSSVKDAESLVSAERLNVYASMADSPRDAVMPYVNQLRHEAIDTAASYLAPRAALGGVALYGGLALSRSRRKNRQLESGIDHPPLTKAAIVGAAAIGLACSATIGDKQFYDWVNSAPIQPNAMRITALDDTPLEGATIDNPALFQALNTGIEYAGRLKDRRVEFREAYLDTVLPELDRQISELPDLREDEDLYLIASDTHAGKAGTTIISAVFTAFRNRYGNSSLRNATYLGDMTQGAGFQRDSIFEQAEAVDGAMTTVSVGNHEGGTTRFIEETDMILADGRVDMLGGLSMYGRPDPQSTPFLGASYYPNPNFTQIELGEQAYQDTKDDFVTAVGLHQPAAVASAFQIDDLRAFLEKPDSTLTDCDEPTSDVRSVNAAIVSAGHWHEQFPLKVVCNPDGTWTTINIQGTAGGANEAPTVNSWSDPDGAPQKDVSMRVAIRNKTYDSVTGVFDIVVTPGAEVLRITRTDIGTPDGAPFEYQDTDASSSLKKEKALRP